MHSLVKKFFALLRFSYFLGTILFFLNKGTSQVHEVGLFFGNSGLNLTEQYGQLKGQIGDKEVVSKESVVGLQYRYNFNNYFSLHASVNYFNFRIPSDFKTLNSTDSDINYKEDPRNSIEFSSRIEYHLLPRSLIHRDIPQLRPYIFVGGGILNQTPDTFLNDEGPPWKYSLSSIMLTGVGFSINANNWLNFGLEFGARFTLEKDFYNFKLKKFLSPKKGNDWYYIFGISTTISFKAFPLVY